MKVKTISRILRLTFNKFVESIEDEKLREMVKENTIITGGAIVSMLLREKVKDYDLYFRTKEVAKAVAKYYVKKYLEQNPLDKISERSGRRISGVEVVDRDDRIKIMVRSSGLLSESIQKEEYQYFETINDPGDPSQENFIEESMAVLKNLPGRPEGGEEGKKYRPIFITSNALTLSNEIQLILRFYGEPEEIHKNYDFVHCISYWSSWDNNLVLNPKALEAILTKELIYQGSLYPICSIIRTRKFIARGWTCNAGQFLKMAFQVGELDLHDYKVLEDQLTGVDVAYFFQLLQMLKDVDPEKINSAFIAELVDKIF